MHRGRNFEFLKPSSKELSVNLTTEPIPGLNFKDPFMISACHWTATENALKNLTRQNEIVWDRKNRLWEVGSSYILS